MRADFRALLLRERDAIAARVWPDHATVNIGTRLRRCSEVAEVERGLPTPTLSPTERKAMEHALATVLSNRGAA